ncbi:MAG: hypothetical protein IPL63_01210 [Saprospiraceae bacterium]|nr:hypothetical protein [Saprospiraceae bacterium]
MSKLRKNTEFCVNLNDVQLSKESISRIESKIQSAVMDELLAYKPNPEDPPKGPIGPIVFIPPRPWPGLILKKLLDRDLDKLGSEFKVPELINRP